MKTIKTSLIIITPLLILWCFRLPFDYIVKAEKPAHHEQEKAIKFKKSAPAQNTDTKTKPHSGVLLSNGEDLAPYNFQLSVASTSKDTNENSDNSNDSSTSSTKNEVTLINTPTPTPLTQVKNSTSTHTKSSTTTNTTTSTSTVSTTTATTGTPTPVPTFLGTPLPPTTPIFINTPTPTVTPTPTIKTTPIITPTTTPKITEATSSKSNASSTAITAGGSVFGSGGIMSFLNSFLSVEQASVPVSNPYQFKTFAPKTTNILLAISGFIAILGFLFLVPRRNSAHFKHYAKQQ